MDCRDSELFRPARNPSTLRSSSKSGQCTPSPRPIRRQLFRSAGVPCLSRGYQSSGNERRLPSDRVTISDSSSAATYVTRTPIVSTAELTLPPRQQVALIDHGDLANPVQVP